MNDIPHTYSMDEKMNQTKSTTKHVDAESKKAKHEPCSVLPVAHMVMDSSQTGHIVHYCHICGMPFTPLSKHKYTAQFFRCGACTNASSTVLFRQMIQSCVMM